MNKYVLDYRNNQIALFQQSLNGELVFLTSDINKIKNNLINLLDYDYLVKIDGLNSKLILELKSKNIILIINNSNNILNPKELYPIKTKINLHIHEYGYLNITNYDKIAIKPTRTKLHNSIIDKVIPFTIAVGLATSIYVSIFGGFDSPDDYYNQDVEIENIVPKRINNINIIFDNNVQDNQRPIEKTKRLF